MGNGSTYEVGRNSFVADDLREGTLLSWTPEESRRTTRRQLKSSINWPRHNIILNASCKVVLEKGRVMTKFC